MEGTTKSSIKITVGFADESTRNVEIGPLAPDASAILNAKTRIKNIDLTPIAGVYLSDSGASATSIVAATVTTQTEREIPLSE